MAQQDADARQAVRAAAAAGEREGASEALAALSDDERRGLAQALADDAQRAPAPGAGEPEALAQAMMERRQNGLFRMQPGYDHSYFFVSSFIRDHIAFHAEALYG